ncbi:pirin family protein [Mucilaginibacter ginsenosidivorax]|uniref:Pirin family protein n=1 Tax=Mucilaginibacter ginsenosidivorax TaxID=862126 RepID=A0A5B8VZD2_9SPHI|nr:pirin family protein [Mucilaginibacter ginsenosidivorax]QEC76977.1 pirin family protein [Mucilaginibacter ginsenosidivorax]
MKTIFYPENERGKNDIGWLKANFSFSFGPYYNPELMSFGTLRVLNDDIIAAGKGFGLHPHDNMEIVTIPLEGGLEHQDNMGNKGVINAGDVQVMSAGTGVYHSEYNASKTAIAKTLQIWLFPKDRNVTPRYDQKSFTDQFKLNELTVLVSPDRSEGNLWLHQDATFSMGTFEAGKALNYAIEKPGNGAYVFLLDGRAKINGTLLNKRDAMGVYESSSFTIEAEEESRYLIIDVPMS